MFRICGVLFFLLCCASLSAQPAPVDAYPISDNVPLIAEVVVRNLELPWDMVWGPEGNIWFSERTGAIKRFDVQSGQVEVLDTVPGVYNSLDNSGLHALMLHPDFPEVPYVYVTFTTSETDLRLSRFPYSSTGLGDEEILLLLDGRDSHNGARLIPDGNGHFFFATGDAYNPMLPQDTLSPNGKVLRFNLDGSIPDDNPIPGIPVYTLGHRNVQGLALTPGKKLWSTEHGESGDDELNRLIPLGNYGWPEVEGLCDPGPEQTFCSEFHVIEPWVTWTPTAGPSGLDYYDHPAIPQWRNCLIAGFLKRRGDPGQRIRVIRLDAAEEAVLDVRDYLHEGPVLPTDLGVLYQTGVFGRIRDVLVAADGSVYLCTSNREYNGRYVVTEDDDRIIRIYNPAYNPQPCPDGCLSIYPNPLPAGSRLFFKFGENDQGLCRVSLFDAAGRGVLDAQLLAGPFVYLDMPQLAAGVYFLRVVFPDGQQVRMRKMTVSP